MGRPTNKKRKEIQEAVERYMKAREDLQLAGRIPITPEGAVRDERVDPALQGEQPLPSIALMAIEGDRKGTWKVPDERKPQLVQEMINIVESQGEEAPPAVVKVMAFNALVKADQAQNEIDNPKESSGSTINNINNTTNNTVFGNIRELIERSQEQEEVGKDESVIESGIRKGGAQETEGDAKEDGAESDPPPSSEVDR